MPNWLSDIFVALVSQHSALLANVLVALLSALVFAGIGLLVKKFGLEKHASVMAVLTEVREIARAVIVAQKAAVADGLKADAADGKITKEELKARLEVLKIRVVEEIKKQMSERLKGILGLFTNDIDGFIANLVEDVLQIDVKPFMEDAKKNS